jgi:hypothetical protein
MGDVFKEQIIKREPSFKDKAIRVCLWCVVVLVGIAVFLYIAPQLGFLAWIALGFGARFLSGYFNVEYEYIFTNGEFDIDVIYDRSRRKRVFSGNVKQFEIIAHIDDKAHEASFSGAQETKDFSRGVSGPDTYVFLTADKGKKLKVIIDPNEKMLKAFSGVLTRRNLHLRPGVVLLSKEA